MPAYMLLHDEKFENSLSEPNLLYTTHYYM